MSEQLTLGFELQDDTTFSTFFAGRNDQLLTILQHVANGRGEQLVYLWGKTGVGRTHLLHSCCQVANQLKLSSFYLSLKQVDQLKPDVLEGLEALNLVCIDDIDGIAGNPEWEEAFFHFYNRMHEEKRRLVIAAENPPNELGVGLNDLVSRLSWGITFHLKALSDEEKLQAIFVRAKNRGLKLPTNVGEYLLRHWPRDMKSLFVALATLDHASFVEQRKLTVPFIKEILKL